jgi:hypothetical protein
VKMTEKATAKSDLMLPFRTLLWRMRIAAY